MKHNFPLHPISKLPMVKEQRSPSKGRWRPLPRAHSERAKDLQSAQKWYVDYQHFQDGSRVGLKCWKCGRDIMGWKEVLVTAKTQANRKPGEPIQAVPLKIGEKIAVQLGVYNHYREGIFGFYRDGIFGQFTYLHCAECVIKDEDGENLLAIFLAGRDDEREETRRYVEPPATDDQWASYMFRYHPEAIDLTKIQRTITVEDLMKGLA